MPEPINKARVAGPPVLFEISWRLRSAYGRSREQVPDVLAAIAAFPGLALTDASVVEEAIELSRKSGQEFTDACIAAAAGRDGAPAVATFNHRHFDRLGARLYRF
jgi:predicted nucleic acid-binding protein